LVFTKMGLPPWAGLSLYAGLVLSLLAGAVLSLSAWETRPRLPRVQRAA
jgi:hypothetical protein